MLYFGWFGVYFPCDVHMMDIMVCSCGWILWFVVVWFGIYTFWLIWCIFPCGTLCIDILVDLMTCIVLKLEFYMNFFDFGGFYIVRMYSDVI